MRIKEKKFHIDSDPMLNVNNKTHMRELKVNNDSERKFTVPSFANLNATEINDLPARLKSRINDSILKRKRSMK